MKKYIISIDEDKNAKVGLLAEVKKDGTILVIGEKIKYKSSPTSLKLDKEEK